MWEWFSEADLDYLSRINRRYAGEKVSNYFDAVIFISNKGSDIRIVPKLLRVGNVDFNKKLVDKILEKA